MVSFNKSKSSSEVDIEKFPGATARGGVTGELSSQLQNVIDTAPQSAFLNALIARPNTQAALARDLSSLVGGNISPDILLNAPGAVSGAEQLFTEQALGGLEQDLTGQLARRQAIMQGLAQLIGFEFPQIVGGQESWSESGPPDTGLPGSGGIFDPLNFDSPFNQIGSGGASSWLDPGSWF